MKTLKNFFAKVAKSLHSSRIEPAQTSANDKEEDEETILKRKQNMLLDAVRWRNVQTTHQLLKEGVSPNFIHTWICGDDLDPFEAATCPLEEAKGYEPMVRLLKHFNALDIKGINALKRQQEAEKREKKRLEYLEEIAPKVKADNDFLDTVLCEQN